MNSLNRLALRPLRAVYFSFAPVAFIFFLVGSAFNVSAQVNSWTNLSSGNWEDLRWSLGVRPGTNQSVMITNANWKAVVIGLNTAANFPQSLNVNSITIASPTNTFNTLFLNYAGVGTPLIANALMVSSNTAVTMLSSALQINDPSGSTFSIGGTFNQGDYSHVTANQMDIGYIGPGVYNLTNGFLTTQLEYLGGGYPAILNQEGGIHSTTILQLKPGADFYLRGGWFTGDVDLSGGTFHQLNGTNSSAHLDLNSGQYVMSGGMVTGAVSIGKSQYAVFQQDGGFMNAPIGIGQHSIYILNGGLHSGNIDAGKYSLTRFASASGGVIQSGGTNSGLLSLGGGSDEVGREYFSGSYTLSNGVFVGGDITLDTQGYFTQWNGSNSVGTITLIGRMINFGYTFSSGTFSMGGGTLTANALNINGGSFYQSAGITRIAGDVAVSGQYNDPFNLSGGLLCDANTSIGYVYNHGFTQSGGTHIITNLLNIIAGGTSTTGYILTGGQLTVSNIQVNSGARFNQTGGTVTQSGTIILANGNVYVGPGAQQFGRLQLINSGNTNSTFYMPSNACLSRFANSSGVAWSTEPTLCIEGWNGSLSGGGNHQIIFGSNATALTASQLDQLRFYNPAGLPAGCYLAKILSTGEIVPNAKTVSTTSLKSQTNGAMRLQIQAVAGHTYQIDVSTNLVDWTFWTNQFTTNGTIQVLDTDATNYSRRFYRATLQP